MENQQDQTRHLEICIVAFGVWISGAHLTQGDVQHGRCARGRRHANDQGTVFLDAHSRAMIKTAQNWCTVSSDYVPASEFQRLEVSAERLGQRGRDVCIGRFRYWRLQHGNPSWTFRLK